MRISRRVTTLILALAVATPAWAEEPASSHDLRCLAIGLNFAAEKKKDLQRLGIMTSFFFLGRLNATAPGLDVAHDMRVVAAEMSDEEFSSEGAKCLEEFTAASKAFDTADNGPGDAGAN